MPQNESPSDKLQWEQPPTIVISRESIDRTEATGCLRTVIDSLTSHITFTLLALHLVSKRLDAIVITQ